MKSKPYKKLGLFLKEKRVERGLTQADVSSVLSYTTPQFVSNWERGHASPPVSSLKKLSKLMKIDPNEFIEVFLEMSRMELEKGLKKEKR